VCRDAGEGAVAGKMGNLPVKYWSLVIAVPIIALVLGTIVKLIPLGGMHHEKN